MVANERAADPFSESADALPLPGFTGTYADALRGIVDRQFCFSQKYQEQQHRAERAGAQPELLDFERKLIKRMFKLGVPMFGHAVVRTAAEQDGLYVRGVTKARAGDSPHNYGCATDIIHGTKAWNLTRAQWALVGHVGKEVAAQAGIDVTWGGDWKFYDPAHWELTKWREVRQRYAGVNVAP